MSLWTNGIFMPCHRDCKSFFPTFFAAFSGNISVMSKGTRSLIIIALAVGLAAAEDYSISRQSAEPQNDPPHQVYAAIPTGGGHFRGPASAQVTSSNW